MATKTWKIGEVCEGGIITVEGNSKKVAVIVKEWDTSQGYSRSGNQSKAKEFKRLEVDSNDEDAYRKLEWFISEVSTSYWASTIMDWVEANCKLEKKHFWS